MEYLYRLLCEIRRFLANPVRTVLSLAQPVLRKPQRLYSQIAALVVALLLLLHGGMAFSQPVTITFLVIAAEADRLQILIDDFEAQHPDIHLNVVPGPRTTNDVEDLYTTSFLLGKAPYDLIYADIIWASKFAAAGWLQDLSPRISDQELAAFMPTDVAGGKVENGFYWMPFRSDVGMLYYRTDLLEAAGLQPPETFAELVSASQILQQKGLVDWGYLWQGAQYEGLATVFVEVVKGFGGFWIDLAAQQVGLDQPAAIAATQYLRDLIEQGISPPGVTNYVEYDTLRLFRSGKAAFLRNWPFVWTEVNRSDSPVRGKVALKSMIHAPDQEGGSCQGGWGFGMATMTQHPEAAWQVIKFFTSEASQRKFVLDQGYVPTRRSLFTDAQILQQYPHYNQLLAVADRAVLRPPIRQYAQVSDVLQRYLSAAITGRLSAEQAMQRAAQETRQILKWN